MLTLDQQILSETSSMVRQTFHQHTPPYQHAQTISYQHAQNF